MQKRLKISVFLLVAIFLLQVVGVSAGSTMVDDMNDVSDWTGYEGCIGISRSQDFVAEGQYSMKMNYQFNQNGYGQWATVRKVLSQSIIPSNKTLSFKIWNRNGAANGVFKLQAYIRDTSGNWHDLGWWSNGSTDLLGWSGDNNTTGAGWITYSKALSAISTNIDMIDIKLHVPSATAFGPGGPGENWVYIDDVKISSSSAADTGSGFLESVLIDNMEDAADWTCSNDAVGLQTSNEWVFKGNNAAKVFYEFNQNGHGNIAVIQKTLGSYEFVEGRALKFRLFNRNGAANGVFKLYAAVQDENNTWYNLPYWNNGNKLGWSGDSATEGDRWYTYCEMIPSNAKKLKAVKIYLENASTYSYGPSGPGENWVYIDDVSLIEAGKFTVDDMEDVSEWIPNNKCTDIVSSDAVKISGSFSGKMYYSFAPGEEATITKTLGSNLDASGKYIKFSIWNRNGAATSNFSVRVSVKDIQGTWITLPKWYNGFNDNFDRLGFSGGLADTPGSGNSKNDGWYTYRGKVPVGTKPIKEIRIQLKNEYGNTTFSSSGPGENWLYIDNVEVTPGDFPFISGESGNYTGYMNKMWQIYGNTSDGTKAVNKYAGEPAYYEWVMNKLEWTDESAYIRNMKNIIRDFPQTSTGWLWSWGSQETWPSDHSKHFDGNAKYVLGVYRIVSWEGTEFLNETDQNSAGGSDASNGKTVLEKTRLAMDYMLNSLSGSSGVLTINNGENTGLSGGKLTNYWDNLRFGYKDAHTSAYYYASLKAISEMEHALGNTTQGNYYSNLMPTVKTSYNNNFWDSTKKRYIGCIDVNSGVHDYGFSYVNLEALTYGLGDQTKANDIFSWLDGTRTISGDNSSGADIYKYKIGPRSNTKAVGSEWWWDVDGAIPVATTGAFDQHQANGGAILYTSYYDLMSRIMYKGADNALTRLNAILNEFGIDELRRDPQNSRGDRHLLGIINEFPESGLIPLIHVKGFLGIDADGNSLVISPKIPTSMKYAGVADMKYRGKTYNVIAESDHITIQTAEGEAASMNVKIGGLTPNTGYTLRNLNIEQGTQITTTYTADANGWLIISNVNVLGNRRIDIYK